MKHITKLKLAAIHQLCDAEDKSTEYMYALMMDTCKVDMDCVNAYMCLSDEEHGKLFLELNSLIELILIIEPEI
jgi:hypothetical protein